MDNNQTNIVDNTVSEGSEKVTHGNSTDNTNTTTPADETMTISKADYNKAIQAAEDRVRTKYSKTIKSLEEKITELTPVEKTDAEKNFEQRLADLERKEKESDERAKALALKTVLQSHGLDANIADYLKPDVDAEAFSTDVEKIVIARMAAGGYKPSGHQTNQPITKAEYDKMSYDEKAELYRRDPESWKRLKN